MKKLIVGVLVIVAVAVALPLLWILAAAAEEFYKTWTYRYRLTVHVSASGQAHSGSSVIQVRTTDVSSLLPQPRGVRRSVSGEAVAIDLADRGALFVLLRDIDRPFSGGGGWNAQAEEIVVHAFPAIGRERGAKGFETLMRRYGRGGERADLASDSLPMLIRFNDLTDPRTVEVVAPDNLAAEYGQGTTFIGATVETVPVGIFPFNQLGWSGPLWLTGVPITKDIKRLLPWIEAAPERRLIVPVNPYDHSPQARIKFGDLLRE